MLAKTIFFVFVSLILKRNEVWYVIYAGTIYGPSYFIINFNLGHCGHNSPCEQLCYELHDGMYECDCTEGFILNKDGYSCQGMNCLVLKKPLLNVFLYIFIISEVNSTYSNEQTHSDKETIKFEIFDLSNSGNEKLSRIKNDNKKSVSRNLLNIDNDYTSPKTATESQISVDDFYSKEDLGVDEHINDKNLNLKEINPKTPRDNFDTAIKKIALEKEFVNKIKTYSVTVKENINVTNKSHIILENSFQKR